MQRTFLRPMTSAVVALLAVVALSGCGGDSENPGSPSPSPTKTPTPNATPGQAFTGNFAGIIALDAGRTGAVAFTVQSTAEASGTLTVTGGTTTQIVPITGFVALSNGNFSLGGRSADGSIVTTVSGTLPSPGGGAGILAIQVGTTIFEGTISAA